MRARLLFVGGILFCVLTLLGLKEASAHGVIGPRFIPESISVLDPFPSDEMDLLAYSHFKDTESLTDAYGAGFSKRLSRDLAVGIDAEYNRIRPNDGSPVMRGFQNIALEVKYAMVRVPEHEFLASTAVEWEVGGTGDTSVGREAHSTVTPQFLFGYGMGDLPDALSYFKPLAVTGQIGITTTIGNRTDEAAEIADILTYGLAVQYSVPYLQTMIKDIGLRWPFNRLFPMVEFNFETVLNGPNEGQTTALVNPGLTWAGRFYQVGVEAMLPLNDRTGDHLGVQALIHLYLDDMFPDFYTWTPVSGVLGPTQR
ncbi:MAG TPA: hypothetical protein VFG95_01725 [Nitrospiria bacterium]|nr:hypothetical protein [Nitrospiria bacterium]